MLFLVGGALPLKMVFITFWDHQDLKLQNIIAANDHIENEIQ